MDETGRRTNRAQARREQWTGQVWDLIRAERFAEARDMMNEARDLGRGSKWQDAVAWFVDADKATPFDEAGDRWLSIQGMIWFSRKG